MPKEKAAKDPEEKFHCCVQAALDRKVEDLVILKVTKFSSFADYFLVCHGQSSRQVRGIASHIKEKMGEAGFAPLGIEGYPEGKWVLMDYSDIIVHIFHKPMRDFYDLERLWTEVPPD
ncbi:MAG: ribosome silencing factor [Deltaproteobacteria bacterium]|nr:ribosome silencing factor [Deltaproteobacteria bacterium]